MERKEQAKRREKYPDTDTFKFHNENPYERVTTGDCTFRAIATATRKPWKQVIMEMADMSCRTGYAINDKKGIEHYLKEQGWTKHKQPKKPDGTKYKGYEFCSMIRRRDGDLNSMYNTNIIAMIGCNHIVCIVHGRVWDTWNSTGRCIGSWWTKEEA